MTHQLRRVTLHRSVALRAAMLACSISVSAPALVGAQDVRIFRAPEGGSRLLRSMDGNRPMIGVTTAAESERADTLGLRIDAVTSGSPAEQAGLKDGDRIQSVNGVSLRADRADAGDEDYSGVLSRRLQRAVQATKPGEAVVLRVLSGGTAREVRVTPVEASSLSEGGGMEVRRATPSDDRAVLGVAVGSTGSPRDTLGVFVQSVVAGGPAEKAGIFEGDRIAAINGVSLRVAREDAEDETVGSMRADRLSREVAKLKAGAAADLTVVSGGRSRTVRVTTAKASDLPEPTRGMMMLPRMDEMLRTMPNEGRERTRREEGRKRKLVASLPSLRAPDAASSRRRRDASPPRRLPARSSRARPATRRAVDTQLARVRAQ